MKARSKSPKNIVSILRPFLEKPSPFLVKIGIHPNVLTLIGVLVTIMVPVSMLKERWVDAGCWLLLAGYFDILDGSVARAGGLKTRFGAFWDSTLDRVSEAIVFGGFLLYYGRRQDMNGLLLAFVVFVFSVLVPYTRARAGALGIDCEVGVLPRPGRILLLAAGFFLVQPTFFLGVVGVLSLITVFQRVHRVWVGTKK